MWCLKKPKMLQH